MTRMTDDELDDSYFNGFNANWNGTDTGVSSLTAGLRAVADAAERRVHEKLTEVMQEAGAALFNDAQFRGASSFEASQGLQVVADLLEMPGPIQYYDEMLEREEATNDADDE